MPNERTFLGWINQQICEIDFEVKAKPEVKDVRLICRHFCGLKRYDFIEPNQENKLGNNRIRVNRIYMSLQFLRLISIQEASKHLGYNMLNQITQPTKPKRVMKVPWASP